MEDRIRQAKATGLHNLPCHRSDANAAWLEIIMAATDLVAWTKLLGFKNQPDLAKREIDTFRYRVLHVAARITRGARQIRLRSTPPGDGPPPFPKDGNDYGPPSPDTQFTVHTTRGPAGPGNARPPSATGRLVMPRCNNQPHKPASTGSVRTEPAARKIEARRDSLRNIRPNKRLVGG